MDMPLFIHNHSLKTCDSPEALAFTKFSLGNVWQTLACEGRKVTCDGRKSHMENAGKPHGRAESHM